MKNIISQFNWYCLVFLLLIFNVSVLFANDLSKNRLLGQVKIITSTTTFNHESNNRINIKVISSFRDDGNLKENFKFDKKGRLSEGKKYFYIDNNLVKIISTKSGIKDVVTDRKLQTIISTPDKGWKSSQTIEFDNDGRILKIEGNSFTPKIISSTEAVWTYNNKPKQAIKNTTLTYFSGLDDTVIKTRKVIKFDFKKRVTNIKIFNNQRDLLSFSGEVKKVPVYIIKNFTYDNKGNWVGAIKHRLHFDKKTKKITSQAIAKLTRTISYY